MVSTFSRKWGISGADFEMCFHLQALKCQSPRVLKSAQECIEVLRSERIESSRVLIVLRSAQECQGVLKSAKECSRVPRSAKECSRVPGVLKSAQEYSRVSRSAQKCQGVLKSNQDLRELKNAQDSSSLLKMPRLTKYHQIH